jgi:hypothetical protein
MIKTEFKFADGQAHILVQATLPIPLEPPLEHEGCDVQHHSTALERVEALLPVVLSELVFGRNALLALAAKRES